MGLTNNTNDISTLAIPWSGTALNAAKGIKNSNRHQTMTKCFHDYPGGGVHQL